MSEILELTIDDLARAGAGVGRDPEGRAVFVPFTAPGDRVRAEVVEDRPRWRRARLVEVVEPAPGRVEPRCAVFGRCGGCQWQHLPYEAQWARKVRGLGEALHRAGVTVPGEIGQLPATEPWGYRNRIQLRGEGEALGFLASGSDQRVDIDDCPIARPEVLAALPRVRQRGAAKGRPFKVEVEVLADGEVREVWDSPHGQAGFRQVHDGQNARLVAWVEARVPAGREVLDLFGGAGNLSRGLAGAAREVHVVDTGAPTERPPGTPSNLRFHRQDVAGWLAGRLRGRKPSRRAGPGPVALLDPPRAGLGKRGPKLVDALVRLGVEDVVLVGCDPDSFARDLGRLTRAGYQLVEVAALDLAPQTPHLESLGRLVHTGT